MLQTRETGKERDDIDMLRSNIPLGTSKEFPRIELFNGNWTPGPFSLDRRNVFIRHQESTADWRKSTAKGGLSPNQEYPRTLRVIDSNTGNVLWERAVFPAKRLHAKS
jgi:hypothetical protein